MLKKKQGLRLYRWIPVVALAVMPLAAVAHADVASPVTTPRVEKQAIGLKVAVVAATDTSGNEDAALRALQAANIGLERQPGYRVANPQAVAKALKAARLQWPFAPKQYPDVRKKLEGTDRVLSICVTPQLGTNATYEAVAELYDTKTGGLVGRGQSLYTVSPPSTDAKNTDSQMRAVDGAVLGAIADMSKPAVLNGVVISRPEGYQVRISLGALGGLRNGSRLEYLDHGQPFAYGTVIDLGDGDSIATVAPESAVGKVQINTPFRTAEIPPFGLKGMSEREISKKEFDEFSKDFAIDSALATIVYLIVN
jgi:hypothetical protein